MRGRPVAKDRRVGVGQLNFVANCRGEAIRFSPLPVPHSAVENTRGLGVTVLTPPRRDPQVGSVAKHQICDELFSLPHIYGTDQVPIVCQVPGTYEASRMFAYTFCAPANDGVNVIVSVSVTVLPDVETEALEAGALH